MQDPFNCDALPTQTILCNRGLLKLERIIASGLQDLIWGHWFCFEDPLQAHGEAAILSVEERISRRFSLHHVEDEMTLGMFPTSWITNCCRGGVAIVHLHATRLSTVVLLSCDTSPSLFSQRTAWSLHKDEFGPWSVVIRRFDGLDDVIGWWGYEGTRRTEWFGNARRWFEPPHG